METLPTEEEQGIFSAGELAKQAMNQCYTAILETARAENHIGAAARADTKRHEVYNHLNMARGCIERAGIAVGAAAESARQAAATPSNHPLIRAHCVAANTFAQVAEENKEALQELWREGRELERKSDEQARQARRGAPETD